MHESHSELYVHLVWATWNRLPSISPECKASIYACLKAECLKHSVELLAIGGSSDHVHVVVRIPTSVAVSFLVKHLKGSSSHFINHELNLENRFQWKGSYSAFSVSTRNLDAVINYVRMQEENHRTKHLHPGFEMER